MLKLLNNLVGAADELAYLVVLGIKQLLDRSTSSGIEVPLEGRIGSSDPALPIRILSWFCFYFTDLYVRKLGGPLRLGDS